MPNETRVVEMQFKNKEFEKNIETSQKSLEKFKKELNFDETSKGLKKFGDSMDALNFTRMADNIQKITDKFTGLGTASEFILSRIRRDLEALADKAINFSKSLTFGQIEEGQQKFEKLNTSVRTIMAATGKSEEEVVEVMKRLNEYTDQTSYNFADMAQNIGKFTSVGIPLEQAEKQMEGIANWAARSGAGINEASRAMYNLSQAMGVGSLKLIDWKSIENAGMATKEFKEQLIEAGVAAGTLEKKITKNADGTEKVTYKTAKSLGKQVEVNFQNMSQTLNKGWANTTVIGNTLMGYYYDDLKYNGTTKMAELTDQQKELMNGLFKETGKINEKGWAKIAESGLATDEVKQGLLDVAEAHGTLTSEIKEDGTKIYTTMDSTGKKIEFTLDTFEHGLKGNWITKNVANTVFAFDDLAKSSYEAAQKCTTFTDVLNAWKDQISTGWLSVFQHIFGGLSESIELFSTICDKVSVNLLDTFGKGGTIDQIFEIWENSGGRESLWGLIIGETESPDGKVLYEGAYGFIDVLTDIKKLISDAFWEFVGSFAMDYNGYTEEKMAGWMDDPELRAQFLAGRMQDLTEKIKDFMIRVKEFFNEIPEGASKSRWETIKDVIKAVFHVISFVAQVIAGLFHFFGMIREQLSPSINAIVELFSILTNGIISTEKGARKGKGITAFFTTLANVLKPVTAVINKIIVGIAELIKAFVKWGKESGFFTDAWQKIKMALKSIWNFISGIGKSIGNVLGDVINAFKDLFANGFSKESLQEFKNKIKATFGGMWTGIKEAVAPAAVAVGDFFKRIWSIVSNAIAAYFSDEKSVGYKIINWLRNAFESLKGGLNRIIPGAVDTIGGFFKRVGEFITNIFSGGTDILGSVKNIWNKVSTAVVGFFSDGVVGTIKKIWSTIRDFFQNLFNPKNNGVADTLSDVRGAAKNAASTVSDTAESVFGKTKSFGQAIIDAFHTVSDFLSRLTTEQWIIIGAVAAIIIIFIKVKKTINRVWKLAEDIVAIKKAGTIAPAMQSFAGKMLMLAGAIGIIALSVKLLGEMDVENGIQGLIGVTAIMLLMVAFLKIAKKDFMGEKAISGKGVAKMVFAFIGIAIAVGRMIKSIAPLAKYDQDELLVMLEGMGAIMAAMVIVAWVAGKNKFDWKSGAGFVLFAMSIAVMIWSLSAILKYRGDTEAILMMLGTLVVIVAAFSILAHHAKDNKGVLYMAALAAAIGIMLNQLMKVAEMESGWVGILKMLAALGGILLLMLGFIKLFPKSGTLKNTDLWQFIPLAVGIWLLIKALIPIANLEWHQIIKMGAIFGMVVVGLIGVIWAINKFEGTLDSNNNAVRGMSKSGMKSVITMALGIAAIIMALKQVAKIGEGGDWSGILKMMAVYLVIVGGIALLIAVINKTADKESGRGFKKSGLFTGLLALVGGIALIIEVLKPLAGYELEELAKMFVPFTLIMAGLMLVVKQVSKFTKTDKQGNQAFKMIMAIVLMLQTIVYMMKQTASMDTTKMIVLFGGLSLVFLAISRIMKSTSKFTKENKNGLQGFAILFALCGVILVFAQSMHLVKNIKTETMLAFAGSLILLSIAVAIISNAFSKMKAPADNKELVRKIGLIAAVLASVAVLAGILVLFAPLTKNVGWEDIAKLCVGVAGLAAVMGIVVADINAIKVVSRKNDLKSKIELLATAALAMVGLMAAFVIITPYAGNSDTDDIVKILAGTLVLALILGIVIKEMNSIKTTNKKTELKAKMLIMAECLVAVAALMAVYTLLAPKMNGVQWQSAAILLGGVLILVGALGLVVYEINKIDVSASKDKLEKKIQLFGTAIAAVAGIMLIFGTFAIVGTNVDYVSMGIYIAGVVAVIAMSVWLINTINKIDVSASKDKLEKKVALLSIALGAVAVIMVAMGAAMVLSGNGDWVNMAVYIAGVAAIIAMAIWLISTINQIDVSASKEKLNKKIELISIALGAVVVVMIAMGAAMMLSANGDLGNMIAYIIGCVAIIAVSVWLINSINKIDVSASKDKLNKKIAMMSIALGAVAAVMLIFSLSLSQIGETDPWAMVAYSAGVLIMVASMVLLLKAFDKIDVPKSNKDMFKKLLIFVLGAAAVIIGAIFLAKCMKDLENVKWEAILAFAAGIGILVIALAAAILILNKVNLKNGIQAIILIGAALAALAALAPMLASGIGEAISTVCKSLYEASDYIAMFSENMDDVKEENIKKAERVIDRLVIVMKKLVGMSKLTSDIKAFSVGLWDMSVALKNFSDVTKNLVEPDNNPAIKVLEYFRDKASTFASINFGEAPTAIAVLGAGLWIFNDLTKEFSNFGSEKPPAIQLLETLISMSGSMALSSAALYAFGGTTATLAAGLQSFIDGNGTELPENPEEVPAFKLLKAFSEMATGLDTLTKLNLDTLGDKLAALGGGMMIFALGSGQMAQLKTMGKLPGSVDEVVESAEELSELSGYVPNVTEAITVLQEVTTQLNALAQESETGELVLPTLPDESTATSFGVQLAALAGGLMQFIGVCEGITGKTQQGLDAIKFLVDINNELNATANNGQSALDTVNIFDDVHQNNRSAISNFGLDLRTLAGGLKRFNDVSSGVGINSFKGLAALWFLAEINKRLTADTVETIKFFPNHQLGSLQLGALGTNLTALASGMQEFVKVEVGDMTNSLSFLDQIAVLNQKLTDAKIQELTGTMSALITPIDKDLLTEEGYLKLVEFAGEQMKDGLSPMSVFTFGITQLGIALSQFVTDTSQYFGNRDYERPIKEALAAVQFFNDQYNLLPSVPQGLLSGLFGYGKDFDELANGIARVGRSLKSFGQAILGNYSNSATSVFYTDGETSDTVDTFNTEVVGAAVDMIAKLTDSYVKISEAVKEFIYNQNVYFHDDISLSDITDGGKWVKAIISQLNMLIAYMYDSDVSGIHGKSVVDNFVDLMLNMKYKMQNITQEDVNKISGSFQALVNLVDVFKAENLPEDNKISDYLDGLLWDIKRILYSGNGNEKVEEFRTDIDKMVSLFESMTSSLNALMAMTTNYQTPGADKIKQAADDFTLFIKTMLYNEIGLLKELNDMYEEDKLMDAYLDKIESISSVIRNIAQGYNFISAVPDFTEALSSIGISIGEAIANGIDNDESAVAIRKGIQSLLRSAGANLVNNSAVLGNSGTSTLAKEVSAKLSTDVTRAFKTVDPNDILGAIRDIVGYENYEVMDMESLGFYFGTMLSIGLRNSSDIVVASVEGLMDSAVRAAMDALTSEQMYIHDFASTQLAMQVGLDWSNLDFREYIKAYDEAVQKENWNTPDSFNYIGYMMALSIGAGIVNGKPLIESAVKTTIKEVIADLSTMMTQPDYVVPLTLSPIIDQTALDQLKTSVASSFDVTNSLTMSMDPGQLEILRPKDYSAALKDLSDTVGKMQDKLDNVYSRMSRFAVILDSGAMVGSFGPSLDRYLGQRGFVAGRGVSSPP